MTSTAYKSQEIATREPQRKPRRKTKPRGIVPSDFSCDLSNQRINYIFDELKKLPVAQYPNATAILLRGLLEMSLSYYLNRTGHLDKMIEAAKKRAEKKGQTFPKTFNPTHKQMLSYVVNSENSIIGNPKVIQALNKLLKESKPPRPKGGALTTPTPKIFCYPMKQLAHIRSKVTSQNPFPVLRCPYQRILAIIDCVTGPSESHRMLPESICVSVV